MRRFLAIAMLALAAVWMSGCGAPATNAPANTNTNANSKPVAAAPTADVLLDMEKKAQEAYTKADGAFFEGMLADKAVMTMNGVPMGKADIVNSIKTTKCEGVTVSLGEPQISKINDDTYAFTYKNDSKGKCTENGKTMDFVPMRASTVWIRNGEKWQAVWHNENPIMTPAGDKKDAANTAGESKKEDKVAPAETKKDEKAAEPKKDEAKKDDKVANSNANSNTTAPAPAKLTPSANTDALAKIHAAGWEAFKSKDAKYFDTTLASTFSGVGPDGSVYASRDAAIKEWTGAGTMKCEGITKTSFTEAFAQSVSPTVEILFGKGNSDGTCDGHKNGDLWQTGVYVKEGDAWKLAFMFEQMPGSGM
jgi:hypothetical protein